jgi:hypothetical protein
MAFHDPLVFSPDGGTTDLDLFRVSTGANTSTYSTNDGKYVIKAEHNYARRTRRVFRLDTNKITADPFIPAQNTKVTSSVYLVADLPVAGYTVDEIVKFYQGINETLTASTNSVLTAWLGGQS